MPAHKCSLAKCHVQRLLLYTQQPHGTTTTGSTLNLVLDVITVKPKCLHKSYLELLPPPLLEKVLLASWCRPTTELSAVSGS